MKNISGKEKLEACLPEPCGGKCWLWASWSQCTAYNQVWFLLITSEVIKEYLRTQDLYLIRSIWQGGICMSSSHIISCGHLSWWKLTFTIKFKCITLNIETRSLEKLTALDLGTCFNWCDTVALPHAANQNMKQEECKYAEVRISQWKAELQTLIGAGTLTESSISFPHPMEFINWDLGESFSLSLFCSLTLLCLCCAISIYLRITTKCYEFGQQRAPEGKKGSFMAHSQEHAIISCACIFLPIIIKASY